MEVGKLTVQLRSNKGKGVARRLRAAEMVPGICYGHQVEEPLAISLSPHELKGALDPEKRQNTVINMKVEDNGNTARELTVMLREYQVHPIKRNVLHVDLVSIDADKNIEAEVPIRLVGKFKGLVQGGQLHVVRHDITVRCKPADIPNEFTLDITELDIGDVLHVSDLTLPENVSSVDSERLTIVTCTAPKAEEEVKEADEGELAEGEGEEVTAEAGDEEKREGAEDKK